VTENEWQLRRHGARTGSINQQVLKCIFIPIEPKPSDMKILFDPSHLHFGSCIFPQCKIVTIFFNLVKFGTILFVYIPPLWSIFHFISKYIELCCRVGTLISIIHNLTNFHNWCFTYQTTTINIFLYILFDIKCPNKKIFFFDWSPNKNIE